MVIYYKELRNASLEDAYAEMEETQEIIKEVLEKLQINFQIPFEKIPDKINIKGDADIFGYLDGKPDVLTVKIVIPDSEKYASEIEKELKNQGYEKLV